MDKHEIYLYSKLFAYSEFEGIDYSMGIALGRLLPLENESYSQFIQKVMNSNLKLISNEDDIMMYELSPSVFYILHPSGEKVLFMTGTLSITEYEDVGSEIDFVTDSREQFDRFYPEVDNGN
jgi:hypothetical protein